MIPEAAQAQALAGLKYLAERKEAFERFLALAGLSAEEVAARAAEPELLAAALDHLAEDEELAAGFCEEAGLTPEGFAALRAAFPGGAQVHWT
ncbi:MAG: DUF3572 family protein [Pseudomonadota bacterium]